MNPMTNVKNIQKLNDKILQIGVEDDVSWHKQYKDSAYIFIGGLPYDLSEGDILCVFSQYGEIIDINLVRDKSSGKSKGYGFLCYEDQRSTILAVDNFNGIKLGGRTIRVDHVSNYRRPKGDEMDENGERKELPLVGCAPKTPPTSESEESDEELVIKESKKKKKKKRKEKSKKSVKDSNKTKEYAKGMMNHQTNLSQELEKEKHLRKVSREKDKDRTKESRNREMSRRGNRERDMDQDKDKYCARGRVRDRDCGRDRDREKTSVMDAERDQDKDRYMDRDKSRNRNREKDMGKQTEREKIRERSRDRR